MTPPDVQSGPSAGGPDLTAWKALARKDLRGAEPETLNRATPEGLTLKALYTRHDTEGLDSREITATAQMITAEGVNNSSARLLPKGTVAVSPSAGSRTRAN